MSNSITWDGVDFAAYNLRVEDYTIPFLANPIFATHQTAQGDVQFTSVNTAEKAIILNCYISGTSQTDLRTNMESVLQRMNPILTDKTLLIDKVPDRRFVGRVSNISAPEIKGMWGFTFTITIQAMSESQATSETNTSQAIATDPDTLTFSSITGNVSRIPAEFYVRNETGASLISSTIVISNDTTNESITWIGTLNDDHWLRFGNIDALGRFESSISVSDGNGADPEAETYSSVLSGYDSGDWLRLKGGVDNDITVAGVSTGTLEITYRGRYI